MYNLALLWHIEEISQIEGFYVFDLARLKCDTLLRLQYAFLLGRLVAGLSPRKITVDLRPVHVRLLVDKVAVGVLSLLLLLFSFLIIIPLVLHTSLSLVYCWRYIM